MKHIISDCLTCCVCVTVECIAFHQALHVAVLLSCSTWYMNVMYYATVWIEYVTYDSSKSKPIYHDYIYICIYIWLCDLMICISMLRCDSLQAAFEWKRFHISLKAELPNSRCLAWRRHFPVHFSDRKYVYFVWNFAEFYSQSSNCQ